MWDGLNSRQRSYLLACFREDQEAERRARAARSTYQDPGPASAWRKLPFSIKAELPFAEYTTIQRRLRDDGRLDAGATLHALARRGLLKITEDRIDVPEVGLVTRVLVELTRAGPGMCPCRTRHRPCAAPSQVPVVGVAVEQLGQGRRRRFGRAAGGRDGRQGQVLPRYRLPPQR